MHAPVTLGPDGLPLPVVNAYVGHDESISDADAEHLLGRYVARVNPSSFSELT